MICRLCHTGVMKTFQAWPFLRCDHCQVVAKHPSVHPGEQARNDRYREHQNLAEDIGYRDFLQPVVDAVIQRKPRGTPALDYGCGPNPVLAAMLSEAGYPTGYFDPLFFPSGPIGKFQIITCTEVVEHFTHPQHEWTDLFHRLAPGGTLFVMTGIFSEGQALREWTYVRDSTHLHFYSVQTLKWIAAHWNFAIEIVLPRLAIFQKPT